MRLAVPGLARRHRRSTSGSGRRRTRPWVSCCRLVWCPHWRSSPRSRRRHLPRVCGSSRRWLLIMARDLDRKVALIIGDLRALFALVELIEHELARPDRPAWNKGKRTGPKPPLRPEHVGLIHAKLQLERRTRDPALFNLAIDSKLRAAISSRCASKTSRPMATPSTAPTCASERRAALHGFELTEVTRQGLHDYLRTNRCSPAAAALISI